MLASANELKYFLEVAGTGNFSRAAERLGVTQPALSQAVQRLERSFGSPLFVRTRTGVQLTRSGHKLFSRGRKLLTEWEDLVQDTLRDETEVRGCYSLGCHPSVALYTLPQVLPELLADHPELNFNLAHDLSRKITERVIAFQLDFGIVINPVKHPGLVIRKLGVDTVGLWTRSQPSSLQDLKNKPVLVCDPELSQTQDLLRRCAKLELEFSRQLNSSNLEVIASLVSQGAGVGILPGRVAARVQEYGLLPAGDQYPTYADTICLVYRSDTHSTQAAKILARSLAAKLQGV
jgi:LysR family transcriptional regulator, cell division regulator